MSGLLDFLARNPKLRTEKEPECSKNILFLIFTVILVFTERAKFQTELELLSLIKLRKNILPPRNLLKSTKTRHLCLMVTSFYLKLKGKLTKMDCDMVNYKYNFSLNQSVVY